MELTRRAARGLVIALALAMAALSVHAAAPGKPSRPPAKGCAWEALTDASVGLNAWVQRCDYGNRKIDFLFVDHALAIRYSDGGVPDPLIDVLDQLPGETPEASVKRHYAANTDKAIAARCVMAPYRETKVPAGVKRYTFVPDAAYRKELKKTADPNEVGDPPCGDLGIASDGIQYYEVHPASSVRKVLFVRVGQDEPLYDENTLQLVPPPIPPKQP